MPCVSLAHLVQQFNSKRKAKIGKGYTEIRLDYEEEAKEIPKTKKKSKKVKSSSKLEKPVQDLMNFIFDMKLIEK